MKDLLQTAAHEGTGSAARILTGSGLSGIRRYRPIVTALIVGAVGFGGVNIMYPGRPDASADTIPVAPDTIPVAPTPSSSQPSPPSVAEQLFPTHSHRSGPSVHSYAVALDELGGLAPDTSPGTRLSVWVAWDPPVTRRPKMQRLIEEVILERIVPPITPQGPFSVVLSVAERHLPRLLFGDRYGSLSVTVLP